MLAFGAEMGADEVETKLRWNPIKSDLSLVTAKNRAEVVRRLWCYVDGINPDFPEVRLHTDYEDCYLLLLRLGDLKMIAKVSNIYRQFIRESQSGSDPSRMILEAKQPLALPVLFEDIERQESPEPKVVNTDGLQIHVYPPSMHGPLQAMRLIHGSAAFPPEVRTWAGDMLRQSRTHPAEVRNALRLWWKQNGTAISNGEFLKVDAPSTDSKVPGRPESNGQHSPRVEGDTRKVDAKTQQSEWWWITGLTAVLTGIAGWLFFRSRRKKQ